MTFPAVIRRTRPAYSEEARQCKYEASVLLLVQVDTRGRAKAKRVVRAAGLGLDEKAMEAVAQWRFKPAYERGKPIVMDMQVEVEFRLR
jgi:protein TonB